MKNIILSLVCFTTISFSASNEIEKLSPEVRSLLSQEMIHIEKGMQKIFSSIIKGDYENINKIAIDIHNSFIFKKELTTNQRKELKEKVSKKFVETDRGFHQIAEKLAIAADFEEKENVEKYFSKMTTTCVKCHSEYATHRFPSLKNN